MNGTTVTGLQASAASRAPLLDDDDPALFPKLTEAQVRLTDRCLQLHGGYGYMREYPIARAYLDARVQTIYGGTTEIMKEIIGRSLGV